MIYFGKNQTELNFGTGDIIMTPVVWEDENVGGLFFKQSSESHTIGQELVDPNWGVEYQDVIMTFSNIESIDVAIKMLNEVKNGMLKSICGYPVKKAKSN